jgi:hypothetical protein
MRALNIAAVAVCIVTGASAFTSPGSLTVVVFDYAATPHKLLTSAVNESRSAFLAAGVATDWIFCSPTQSCYVPEQFVQVKILARALKTMPISHQGLAATTACTFTDNCSSSYLFLDRIVVFAGTNGSPLDVALGYVMAHEIGHLMGLGHRPGGIMSASFTARDLDRASSGWLNFADDDARQLRAAAARTQIAGDPLRRVKLTLSPGGIAE